MVLDPLQFIALAALVTIVVAAIIFSRLILDVRRQRAAELRLQYERVLLDRERELDERELVQRERTRATQEEQHHVAEQKELHALLEELRNTRDSIDSDYNANGYIVMDVQDRFRSSVIDIFRGFEDYAKLKGYFITFSANTTISNKLAFKFTLQEEGVSVSTQTVRKHIHEYIEKVQKGDTFDDIPVIISVNEHHLVCTALKNRLALVEYQNRIEKNMRGFYENFFKRIQSAGFLQAPIHHIGDKVYGDKMVAHVQGDVTIVMRSLDRLEEAIDEADAKIDKEELKKQIAEVKRTIGDKNKFEKTKGILNKIIEAVKNYVPLYTLAKDALQTYIVLHSGS